MEKEINLLPLLGIAPWIVQPVGSQYSDDRDSIYGLPYYECAKLTEAKWSV
jgi:hypothetical protein